jgi:hypothetical protein
MQARSFFLFLALCFLVAWVSAKTAAEKLVDLTNDYREENGLPRITMSYSLTKVATLHTLDMNANGAVQGDCNMHSWSDKGFNVWNSCCYTSDHAEAECMWDKPREITFGSFTGFGYENAAKSGEGDMTPEEALELWKASTGHNHIILNKGIWEDIKWRSIGASVCGEYAVLWFSETGDAVVESPSTLTCESVTLPTGDENASTYGGRKSKSNTAFGFIVFVLLLCLCYIAASRSGFFKKNTVHPKQLD